MSQNGNLIRKRLTVCSYGDTYLSLKCPKNARTVLDF